MSHSSDEEQVLYAQRKEWVDVVPIPQHENVTPVSPIFYTDEYRDATSYFRAIVKSNEHSQRVLDLTYHIISLNPAHYTVWQYRWRTLLVLYPANREALLNEQTLMEAFAIRHLKTYQVWHHRRLLLLHLKNPRPELLFISNALQTDVKNYHTWAYRQWILAHFGSESEGGLDEDVWDDEIKYVEEMLEEDVRNNSAWQHRFFVVWHPRSQLGGERQGEILRRELSYVKSKISLAPSNLSTWNYLRGILDKTHTPLYDPSLLMFVDAYTKSRESIAESKTVDLDNPLPGKEADLPCAYAVEFMADALVKRCADTSSVSTSGAEKKATEKRAVELFGLLAAELDPMRKSYWNYRAAQLTQLDRLEAQVRAQEGEVVGA